VNSHSSVSSIPASQHTVSTNRQLYSPIADNYCHDFPSPHQARIDLRVFLVSFSVGFDLAYLFALVRYPKHSLVPKHKKLMEMHLSIGFFPSEVLAPCFAIVG
jgi:hypothetical protein